MRIIHFFPSFLALILIQCQSNESPKLRVKHVDIVGFGENEVSSEKTEVVTSDYFEIVLLPQTRTDSTEIFVAHTDLAIPLSKENFQLKYFEIVDDNDNIIFFDSPTDFLHYLSERGYALVSKKEEARYAIYTFRKR